ncbi:5'-flap endonuclease [Xylographa trunciseda]|nr:5'-flap endonuclease [Xylographa trunciseda]
MASTEVIVLSSSPSRSLIATTPPRDFDHFLMSSSPSFPSPSQLLLGSRRPSLQSGSRVNALPAGAVKGFMRASCLLDPENIVDTSTRSLHTSSQLGQHKTSLGQLGPCGLEGAVAKVSEAAPVPVKKPRAPRKKSENNGESKTTVVEENPERNRGDVPAKKPRVRKSKDMSANNDDLAPGDPAPKKPRARKSKADIAIAAPRADGVLIKKPRTRKSKDASTDNVIVPGDGPVKKSRVRKSKGEGQTTIAKSRIIKPSVAHGSEDRAKSKETPIRKRPLPKTESILAEGSKRINISEEPLGLDVSIPRKRDWTPLRDDDGLNKSERDQPDGLARQPTIDAPVGNMPQAYHFSTLHGDFGYVQLPNIATPSVAQRMVTGEAPTKRQKLELIDIPGGPPIILKPEKGRKIPKKKPQTITEKATADFRPVPLPIASSPIVQYLAQPTQNVDPRKPAEVTQIDDIAEKRTRKVSVRTKKSKDIGTGAKKSAPVLMMPEEAMKATKDQDLLFGTSSQLMREDSPSFVRDLQAAIKASESLDSIVNFQDARSPKSRSSATSLSVLAASRKLWSEAARDSQGELLDVEMVDMANTPNVQKSMSTAINTKPLRMEKGEIVPAIDDQTWKSVNDFASPAHKQMEAALSGFQVSGDDLHDSVRSIPRSVAEAALRARTKSRSPVKTKKLPAVSKEPTSEMPRFQAYTMNELGKAISGYGFKSIKSRDAMIALLEKCWESKNRLALQSLTPNTNTPNLAANGNAVNAEKPYKKSPAKRRGRRSKFDGVPTVEEVLATTSVEPSVSSPKPRGRPRKNTTLTTTTEIITAGVGIATSEMLPAPKTPPKSKRKAPKALVRDDIEDPNPPPTPSPPRRRTPLSPPQALSLANSALATTTNGSMNTTFSSQTQPALFAKITEAVTTFPPTHDPKNLTWYEKILLYDPIVLEDLATWLNTEGLGRVGVDEEVHPGAVRAWCEENSVCCLWKQNLRGGARKRY